MNSQAESYMIAYSGIYHRWVPRRLQTPGALDVVGQWALVGHLSGFVETKGVKDNVCDTASRDAESQT